ncbi:hypothetical protein E2C01_094698 [Portunus trituberculatus]|uniref:Uncharacterized protein n=2 Tax=Portunus trituberculatus TaxID=210409 RepID=A0A5B7JT25_PORTR|nr:hypothetical protein [Portunus trituberculatus]
MGVGGGGLDLAPLPSPRRVPIKMLVSDGKPVSQQHTQYQHTGTHYSPPLFDMGGYFQSHHVTPHVRSLSQSTPTTHTYSPITQMSFNTPTFHQDFGVGHSLPAAPQPGTPMHYTQEEHNLSTSPQFPSGFTYHSQT